MIFLKWQDYFSYSLRNPLTLINRYLFKLKIGRSLCCSRFYRLVAHWSELSIFVRINPRNPVQYFWNNCPKKLLIYLLLTKSVQGISERNIFWRQHCKSVTVTCIALMCFIMQTFLICNFKFYLWETWNP